MKVWSYCAVDWKHATKAAGRVTPFVTPPLNAKTVDLKQAAASDLVYLNLHGYRGQANCYGQQADKIGPTALTPERIKERDWRNTVIFAEVCFSAADGGSQIARAFLDGGADAFIGSTTEAYGRVHPTIFDGEADKLAYFFIKSYQKIGNPYKSLEIAKKWLKAISYPLDADDKSTLESFICLTKKSHTKDLHRP